MKVFFIKIMLVLSLLGSACFNAFSQNEDMDYWQEMYEWMDRDGARLLASYAHPNDDYIGHSITSFTSSKMVVRIQFRAIGLIPLYSTYEIARGDYEFTVLVFPVKLPYFRNVIERSNGSPRPSFQMWNTYGRYPRLYEESKNAFEEMYGRDSFYSLSDGKKAAAALEIEFLEKLWGK